MAAISLPNPFSWQDHLDGKALTLRDRAIAFVTSLPNGRVRCTRKLQTRYMTHSFHEDLPQATRFIEAWAHRWEREIVTLYDGLAGANYQATYIQEARNDPAI